MEMSQAVRLLSRSERLLGLLGVWPLNPNDTRFALILGYTILLVALEWADLIQFINDLEHVVANLTQNITFTIILFKVIMLRWSNRELETVIKAVKEDFRAENYRTATERRVFLANYRKAASLVGILLPMVSLSATCMYLAPLTHLLRTINSNQTLDLNLPFHTRTFHDISKIPSYALAYAAQLPFVFIGVLGHTSGDSLMVILFLHICGQLSVLVKRIDNLSNDGRECGPAMKKLVKMHVRLISMTTTLGEAFNIVLLIQVLGGMLLICVLSYDLLVHIQEGRGLISADFFNFLSYICGLVILMYTYCYVGESLVRESSRVVRAFSECGWEEMPTRHAKSIIICMARSQRPLGLTAGKFYTLSLNAFTGILRTSMAYFSVLRTLV